MHSDDGTSASDGWQFLSLAHVWDSETRAIVKGADKLEVLSDADRARSLATLSELVRASAQVLDEGRLLATAFSMLDDLYKTYYREFRWSPGVADYIAGTAGVFMGEFTRRGLVLNYVIDNTTAEADLDSKLTYVPAIFDAATLLVAGPQLMALKIMEQIEARPRDVTAVSDTIAEGQELAERLITRCHEERRSCVYLNLQLDDDGPGLSLDVALSQCNTPGTIVVFRNQPAAPGSTAKIYLPPGITLPDQLRGERQMRTT